MRLLYFSPVHSGSYAQRPHFTVRAWLARGAESALWVSPYPCRLPRWQDMRRGRGLHDQGTPPDAGVRVLHVPALPIEPLPFGSAINRRLLWGSAWREMQRFAADGPWVLGIGRPSALALAALRELRPTASFFDAMDNFPEFHRGLSRRAMRRHEDAVANEVDLVVASSTFLADKFTRRGLRVVKVLNAGQWGEGRETSAATAAHEQSIHHSSFTIPHSTVLGYLGCIGAWFDWPLAIRLAEALPKARVELVGPCLVGPPKRLPDNLRLLPPCRQTEAAGHLRRFSAGLIPFRNNALTSGVDPIKYYEYRGAGLPVLSTRFGEMALRGRDDGVYFLDQTGNLPSTVARALSVPRDDDAARRFRRQHDWAARFVRSDPFRSLLSAQAGKRAA